MPKNYELYKVKSGEKEVYLMKRKKFKRRLRKKPIPEMVDYNKILQIVNEWGDTGDAERFKYFFIASYLLGARVSEVLQTHRADWKMKYIQDTEIMQVTMITQKTGDDGLIRKVPIFLNGYERELSNMFLDYLKYFSPKEKLFNFSRCTAWRHIKKIDFGSMVLTHSTKRHYVNNWFGHPHYFRHLRATHLREYYGFDTGALQKYFGWKTPQMAMRYTKTDMDYLVGLYRKS